MSPEVFIHRSRFEAPAEEVFRWHALPGALERLTPPWEGVEVIERGQGIRDGSRVVLRIPAGPVGVRWVAEHSGYVEGHQFRDVQVSGPFARWEHTHTFQPDGPLACFLEDRIEYAPPLGALGRALGGPMLRSKLRRMFEHRHRVLALDLAAHARHQGGTPMHVVVSGASGLVGSALIPFLSTGGHKVSRFARSGAGGEGSVAWDPGTGAVDAARLVGIDAVVHLAGENLFGLWTEAKRKRIRDSRIRATRLLCESLAKLPEPPKVFLGASAVGYYGDRGEERLSEASVQGQGFLAELCRDWEAATEPIAQAGARVVSLRLGVVLSPKGGALAKMLTPFRMGVGGTLGNGKQYMSWIALDDAIGAFHHALMRDRLAGPVNVVAPQAVTNREFTKTLGKVLSRPTIFPVPAALMKLVFRDMAREVLLGSQRVEPARLEETGYPFRYPDLEGALRAMLGR